MGQRGGWEYNRKERRENGREPIWSLLENSQLVNSTNFDLRRISHNIVFFGELFFSTQKNEYLTSFAVLLLRIPVKLVCSEAHKRVIKCENWIQNVLCQPLERNECWKPFFMVSHKIMVSVCTDVRFRTIFLTTWKYAWLVNIYNVCRRKMFVYK